MDYQDIKDFYRSVVEDETFKKSISAAKEKYSSISDPSEKLKRIVSEVVIPIAHEKGYSFSVEDFINYENQVKNKDSAELSDEDLLDVSGGLGSSFAAICLSSIMGLSALTGIGQNISSNALNAPSLTKADPVSSSYSYNISNEKDSKNDSSKLNQNIQSAASQGLQSIVSQVKNTPLASLARFSSPVRDALTSLYAAAESGDLSSAFKNTNLLSVLGQTIQDNLSAGESSMVSNKQEETENNSDENWQYVVSTLEDGIKSGFIDQEYKNELLNWCDEFDGDQEMSAQINYVRGMIADIDAMSTQNTTEKDSSVEIDSLEEDQDTTQEETSAASELQALFENAGQADFDEESSKSMGSFYIAMVKNANNLNTLQQIIDTCSYKGDNNQMEKLSKLSPDFKAELVKRQEFVDVAQKSLEQLVDSIKSGETDESEFQKILTTFSEEYKDVIGANAVINEMGSTWQNITGSELDMSSYIQSNQDAEEDAEPGTNVANENMDQEKTEGEENQNTETTSEKQVQPSLQQDLLASIRNGRELKSVSAGETSKKAESIQDKIKAGAKLKSVDQDALAKKDQSSPKTGLLGEIEQGKQLKHVERNENEKKDNRTEENSDNSMYGALKRAMDQRRFNIEDDDDTTDITEDSEWDD